MYYQLFNIQGQLLTTKRLESDLTNIVLTNLVPSIYFIKLIQGNSEVKMFKIIKY